MRPKFAVKTLIITTHLLAVAAWQTPALGFVENEPPSLDQLADRANLIFKGEVVKVESRFAQPVPGQKRPAPYTFVTYKVEQTLKGELTENTMTLRFAGGPYNHDEFTLIDGVPLMDVGDRDVLFVKDNGEDPCPLVDCGSGRFREIDGFIFNELGQSIELTETNEIRFGKAVSLDQVQNHKMSDDIHINRYESELVDEYMSVDSFRETQPEYGMRPDPAGFVVMVGDAVQRAAAAGGEVPREKNLNADEPFADNFFVVPEAPAAAEPTVKERIAAEVDEPWPTAVTPAKSAPAVPAFGNAEPVKPTPKIETPEAIAIDKIPTKESRNMYRVGGLLLVPAFAWLWLSRRRNARR